MGERREFQAKKRWDSWFELANRVLIISATLMDINKLSELRGWEFKAKKNWKAGSSLPTGYDHQCDID